jgi:lsr operon transcriptional repressor
MGTRRAPRRARPRADTPEDLATRIAWLYYKEKLTQEQIAQRISLSRQKVQRLLEKARDLEIVQFNLKHPFVNLLSVEMEVRERFGLRDAVVVPSAGADPAVRNRAYAIAGAAYLQRKLAAMGPCTLGIGWGNTTALLADFFEPESAARGVQIVSLIGNLMMNVAMNPYIMAEKIARKLEAPFYNIWAPAIAQSRERAEVFKSEPWIKEVLDIGKRATAILVSIGEATESASLFTMGYLSPADLRRLIGKGAVGDILCRFFDATGRIIEDEVHDRVIGVPMDVFGDPDRLIIGVAGGPAKVAPIRAALRKRYVNVLITDETTAAALLLDG